MPPRLIILSLLATVLLAGCASGPTATQATPETIPTNTASALTTPGSTATPTIVPATPTPTALPPALKVNGEAVPLIEYQASLKQLSEAEPNTSPADQRKRVIAELVNETLLAQAAFKGGFNLDDQALQARIDQLAEQTGGIQALSDWQTRMGYTPDSFKSALRRAAAAAWQRDQIMNTIPTEMEQVHARQILVQSETLAKQVEQQSKQAGTDFATLAFGYDLKTGGDLSWFPRGYLNEAAVEEAAFALQPGEISPVIKSSIWYHILQVIAKQTRPLSPDARLALQRKALARWLEDSRKQSQVDELIP